MWPWYVDETDGGEVCSSPSDFSLSQGLCHQFGGRSPGGAELTKDLCHLTFRVKVTDPRAINPHDTSPLSCAEDGVFGNLFQVQSQNYCFIMKSLLDKDSNGGISKISRCYQIV